MKLKGHRPSLKNIEDSVHLIDAAFLSTAQYMNSGLSQLFD